MSLNIVQVPAGKSDNNDKGGGRAADADLVKIQYINCVSFSEFSTYIYEFARLDDANYKERDTGIKAIKQVVHPQPSAKFSDRLTRQGLIRTCIGEGVDLDVELGGAGPYTLFWNVFNAGERHSFEEVATEARHTITIPPLDIGGKYVVSLAKVCTYNERTSAVPKSCQCLILIFILPWARFKMQMDAARN
jgi:hypothetical protein